MPKRLPKLLLRLAWLAKASALVAPQHPKTPTRLRAAPLVELYGERISINDETLVDTLSLKETEATASR